MDDRFQGRCDLPVRAMGDVVIRRRDGIFAYQLAVVVDDADQGITDDRARVPTFSAAPRGRFVCSAH